MWTYSADPSSSDKDAIRFLLGDTDPNDPLTLSDGEIDFLLTQWDYDVYFAAAAGADQIAAQYAKEAPFSADGVAEDLSTIQQKYTDLAANLRWQAKRQRSILAMPYVGGSSRADIEKVEANCDEVRTAIREGITDNRWYGGYGSGADERDLEDRGF